MIVDTNTNNAAGNPVAGKRKGVTPAAAVYTNIGYAGATNGIANMNTSSGIYVLINQPAWNSHHSDSVDSYAWRARKITRSGSVGGWYYATTRLADVDWNTGFNASTVNATNAQIRATVNISGETFSSNLTTAENRSGYSNGTVLFNDSNSIEIQVAAVKDLDNSAVAGDQPNEIGQWSSSLKFATTSPRATAILSARRTAATRRMAALPSARSRGTTPCRRPASGLRSWMRADMRWCR